MIFGISELWTEHQFQVNHVPICIYLTHKLEHFLFVHFFPGEMFLFNVAKSVFPFSLSPSSASLDVYIYGTFC